MKLVRYATVYLQPSPARELQMVDLNVDTVEVHLSPAGKDAHQSRFLIEAAVVLNERPEVADDGTIIVPTEPRRKAEDAMRLRQISWRSPTIAAELSVLPAPSLLFFRRSKPI